jgi:hypothetical protein
MLSATGDNPAMKLKNIDTVLCNFEGEPVQFDGKALTLRRAITVSVSAQFAEEQTLGMEEKIKRYRVARRVHHANPWTDFPAEDLALMKRQVARNFTPMVAGLACDMIDDVSEPLPNECVAPESAESKRSQQ